jgi:hypothetical protein
MFVFLIPGYASKGDTRFSGHVSFYHESGSVSHSVYHHESGHVSHFVYREMSVRMAHLRVVSPLKSVLSARVEQWQRLILPCSSLVLTISFPFWTPSPKILW